MTKAASVFARLFWGDVLSPRRQRPRAAAFFEPLEKRQLLTWSTILHFDGSSYDVASASNANMAYHANPNGSQVEGVIWGLPADTIVNGSSFTWIYSYPVTMNVNGVTAVTANTPSFPGYPPSSTGGLTTTNHGSWLYFTIDVDMPPMSSYTSLWGVTIAGSDADDDTIDKATCPTCLQPPKPVQTPESPKPSIADNNVRYADGIADLAFTDLETTDPEWGYTRSWTNATAYLPTYDGGATKDESAGSGTTTTTPTILKEPVRALLPDSISYEEPPSGWVSTYGVDGTYVNGLMPADWGAGGYTFQQSVALVTNGHDAEYFQRVIDPGDEATDGDFHSAYSRSLLHYDNGGGDKTYTVQDVYGTLSFFDADGHFTGAGNVGSPRGILMLATSSGANVGKPADEYRTATDGTDDGDENVHYAYVASGANAGKVESVTLRHRVSGSWVTVRKAEYTYYGSSEDHGNLGDLKLVQIKDASGNVIDEKYYRYYTGESGGYVGALKYAFDPDAYARLKGTYGTPDSATDTQIAPYADFYFEYDGSHRVVSETVHGAGCSMCSGGQGTYTFDYDARGGTPGDGRNVWTNKTTETLPDGTENVVYTNSRGEVLLKIVNDTAASTSFAEYWKYDDNGNVILHALPSAIDNSEISESLDALVGDGGSGDQEALRDDTGQIETYTYYANDDTVTGSAPDRLKKVYLSQGEDGDLSTQVYYTYEVDTVDGEAIYPLHTQTVYRNDDNTGAETTTYDYTFDGTTHKLRSMTTTLPTISASQNGSGSSTAGITFYDDAGNVQWTKDADGHINFYEYDPTTGGLLKSITDVDTDNTTDFSDLPGSWSNSSGLHLISTFEIDDLGRTTKATSPNGNVTYTVYNDPDHEVRIYSGWNSTAHLPTGPTVVMRQDRANRYTETITMTATPDLDGGNLPTGDESISGIQTLSRDKVNLVGQVTESDRYFYLSGLTYSTSSSLGTVNTNYYASFTDYGDRGWLKRTETPTGTITRYIYDGRGNLLQTWVGTDDTPTTGYWSPANVTGTNLTLVTENEYDGGDGGGDGNLTQTTQHVSGSDPDRVTQYFYDWRDRLVATKMGVQGSESTSDNTHPISYATYDNLGEVTGSYQYDGDNVSIVDTVGGADGVPDPISSSLLRAKSTTDYDDMGRTYATHVFSVDPSSGTVASGSIDSFTWYDNRGNVIKSQSSGGAAMKAVYDGAGRQTIAYVTDAGGDAAAGASGNWSDAGSVSGDHVLEQSETTYDADGNAIFTKTRQRFHDATDTGALGNPSSTSGTAKARVSYSEAYYDALDRLTASVDLGTNGGSSYTRDTSIPSRADDKLVTSYSYDSAGRVQDVTDPKALVTRTTYDALGRTTKTVADYTNGTPTDTSNQTTNYGYDGSDHVTSMTADMPSGTNDQTTAYVYGVTTGGGSAINSNDVLSAVQYPSKSTGAASSGEEEDFTVDATGARTSYTDRNGNVHLYSYDVLGRLTLDSVDSVGGDVDDSVQALGYTYNTQGLPEHFKSYSDAAATTVVNDVKRVYNGLGQLQTEYQQHDGAVNTSTSPKVQYSYDDLDTGSRAYSMTYPNGRVLTYDYGTTSGLNDTIGRLSAIKDGATTLESYSYLGTGTVISRSHPEPGIDLSYVGSGSADGGDQYVGLDRFGRVVQQAWTNTGTDDPVEDLTYTYDRDSNRLIKQNNIDIDQSDTYTYDDLNRLTSFARRDPDPEAEGDTLAHHDFDYDAVGNRNFRAEIDDGDSTYNSQNQMAENNGADVFYDDNGNMTSPGLSEDDGTTFTYDAWNRMVSAQFVTSPYDSPQTQTLRTNSYDALGRKVTSDDGKTAVRTTTNPNMAGAAVTIDGTLYFAGSDSAHGSELWKTNGTPGGTMLVKDMNAGSGSSSITWMTNVDGTLFFMTDAGLWKSDGTSLGTVLLSEQTGLYTIAYQGDLYFVADDGDGHDTLWKSDGTELGTESVAELFNGESTNDISIAVANDLMFFCGLNEGEGIWMSDGTEEGTEFVDGTEDANAAYYLNPCGDQVYFATLGSASAAQEPWVTDGTTLGTHIVKDIVSGSEGSNPTGFTAIDGTMYFLADTQDFEGTPTRHIWSSDGTSGGTSILGDTENPVDMYAIGDNLLFTDSSNNLWRADPGTGDATQLTEFSMYRLGEVNGFAYFVGNDGSGSKVWQTDGTVAGTHPIAGVSTSVHVVGSAGDSVYFNGLNSVSTLTTYIATAAPTDYFYSSDWQVLEEAKGGYTTAQNVWSPVYVDAMIERDRDADLDIDTGDGGLEERLYAVQDANYNVTALVDTDGDVQERFQYDPYGAVTTLDASWDGTSDAYAWTYLFQGGRYDATTGLYNFRNREYSPTLGRWMREDPKGYNDGPNLYVAFQSNPVLCLDPIGLQAAGAPTTRPGTPTTLEPLNTGDYQGDFVLRSGGDESYIYTKRHLGTNAIKMSFTRKNGASCADCHWIQTIITTAFDAAGIPITNTGDDSYTVKAYEKWDKDPSKLKEHVYTRHLGVVYNDTVFADLAWTHNDRGPDSISTGDNPIVGFGAHPTWAKVHKEANAYLICGNAIKYRIHWEEDFTRDVADGVYSKISGGPATEIEGNPEALTVGDDNGQPVSVKNPVHR